MHIAIQLGLFLAAWRWSDWKHWRNYYPSILFVIAGDLVYNFLTYNYPLWKFLPATFDQTLFRNHTLISLGIDFLGFPSMVLLYLSRLPKTMFKQGAYILAWTSLNTLFEWASHTFFDGISYEHGWNFGWSVLVNLFLFILLKIHQDRPLWAWAMFLAIAVFFIRYFKVPISGILYIQQPAH